MMNLEENQQKTFANHIVIRRFNQLWTIIFERNKNVKKDNKILT